MNEQDACDDDERLLHEWKVKRDKETKSQQVRTKELGLFIPKETWVPVGSEDLSFLEDESVSKPEVLNYVFRFILREQRRVIVTLGNGVVRICVHRLPRNKEEEKIIQYMLALLSEGRETDKGIIDKLLPSFERCFEFVQFLVDYRENDKKMPCSASDAYKLVMATLIQQRTDNTENSNSP